MFGLEKFFCYVTETLTPVYQETQMGGTGTVRKEPGNKISSGVELLHQEEKIL
ncbi:MAG: hypothetical protein HOF21_06760 [Nitrospina sp.]|nr:hypothetical protein [Nitrospina sp.]MBT5632945.1 hypothetical protein [Nitrospina sp.]